MKKLFILLLLLFCASSSLLAQSTYTNKPYKTELTKLLKNLKSEINFLELQIQGYKENLIILSEKATTLEKKLQTANRSAKTLHKLLQDSQEALKTQRELLSKSELYLEQLKELLSYYEAKIKRLEITNGILIGTTIAATITAIIIGFSK